MYSGHLDRIIFGFPTLAAFFPPRILLRFYCIVREFIFIILALLYLTGRFSWPHIYELVAPRRYSNYTLSLFSLFYFVHFKSQEVSSV